FQEEIMAELTKLFYHTGTTDPTDVGPAMGGVLHSLIVPTSNGANFITLRDGGAEGAIIFKGDENLLFQRGQLKWQGVKLNGQLNIEVANVAVAVVVEMSEIL